MAGCQLLARSLACPAGRSHVSSCPASTLPGAAGAGTGATPMGCTRRPGRTRRPRAALPAPAPPESTRRGEQEVRASRAGGEPRRQGGVGGELRQWQLQASGFRSALQKQEEDKEGHKQQKQEEGYARALPFSSSSVSPAPPGAPCGGCRCPGRPRGAASCRSRPSGG